MTSPRVSVMLEPNGDWSVRIDGENGFGGFERVYVAERKTRDAANEVAKALRAAIKVCQ